MRQGYYNQHQVNGNSLDSRIASLTKGNFVNNHKTLDTNLMHLIQTQSIPHNPRDYMGENLNNVDVPELYKDDKPILSLAAIANAFGNVFDAQPGWLKFTEIIGSSLLAAGCVSTNPVVEETYLNVPVIKQEQDKWCLPASTKSVMNYHSMEITQKEIADYVIGEDGWGWNSLLVDNASKLGINAYNDYDVSFNGIKQELIKGKTMIVALDYSLTDKTNHSYVIDGFDDTTQKIRLMCPKRGYVYWTYDEFKELNNNLWIDEFGYGSDTFCITFVSPKNKSTIDNLTNTEKAIQIVREQTDLFDIFK